jgi:hypothetical protein
MSYLPGVPNMGPKPVSPTVSVTKAGGGVGHSGGIGGLARSVGKPGNTEHLGSVVGRTGKGLTAVGGGNQAMHSLNNYGKAAKAPALLGGSQTAGGVDPTQHAGVKQIRGSGLGQISSRVRQGGLGPGRASTPGPSDTDYSAQSEDTE